jgi:hypothetical protein
MDDIIVTVHHRGNPGWTATDMLNDLDGPTTGLRSALLSQHQFDDNDNNNNDNNNNINISFNTNTTSTIYNVVIILVGTNDIGRRHSIEQIVDEIQQLHTICFEYGVLRTVAVAVPPSGFQYRYPDIANQTQQLNNFIQQYSISTQQQQQQQQSENNKHKQQVIYYPFPFEYNPDDEKWSMDQLHLTPIGYQILGENLAPVINDIINDTL